MDNECIEETSSESSDRLDHDTGAIGSCGGRSIGILGSCAAHLVGWTEAQVGFQD